MTFINMNRRTLGRRGLLAGAAALAIGAVPFVGGGSAFGSSDFAGPDFASPDFVDDSRQFNIGGSGGYPFVKKQLHANWVLQSFGYDNLNNHIYFLQTNEDNTATEHVGDIWVTKTDLAGNEIGAMALRNFGHGVAVGVEPYNGTVYLWTEWKVNPTSGYGTRIGRFEFVNGATLMADDPSIQDRTPSIGEEMTNPQPSIDPSTDRLLVRYKVGADLPRIVVFPMSNARAGNLTVDDRKAERALPSRGAWGAANPFQGLAAYGRYAYLLEGPVGNPSYITTIDLNGAGQTIVEDRHPTTAGASLPGREPQGMAIWLSGPPNNVSPRLAFGFHSNTGGVRQASVYFKDSFY
jgi:hypothetical protein